MKRSLRNVLAALASVYVFMFTVGHIVRLWPWTLELWCGGGRPLWQRLVYPVVPLFAASVLAGALFAFISTESVRRAAVLTGCLVVMSPLVPAYTSHLRWPEHPFAWGMAILAGLPSVLAVRRFQSWVRNWRGAT